MATSSRPSDPDVGKSPLEKRLRNEPYLFEFFQAVRLLERFLPDKVGVGKFAPPSAEVARFQANSTLAFPASEIQALTWPEKGPVEMKVNFMGLTGPEGVLPLNYTVFLAERARAGDSSAADLFDIFNHRIISLFFQAWEKYRFWIAYERGDRDQFSHHLLDLIGLGTRGLQDRQAVPDDSLLYYSGLLAQHPRSAVALEQILNDYFEVPVEVEQFAGGWYRLDTSDPMQPRRQKQLFRTIGSWRGGGRRGLGPDSSRAHKNRALVAGPVQGILAHGFGLRAVTGADALLFE